MTLNSSFPLEIDYSGKEMKQVKVKMKILRLKIYKAGFETRDVGARDLGVDDTGRVNKDSMLINILWIMFKRTA